jgi:FkbM family methyltransferase
VKHADSWHWPDGEQHMLEWMAQPKNRRVLNGRPAYQGKKQEVVRQVCSDLTHMRTAVDVGAHIGLWSFNLAHWFKTVHAFEPVTAHRECFEKNVFDAPGYRSSSVVLHPFAVGREAGSVNMRVNPTSTGDSWVKGAGDIPMVKLDSQDLQDVDLIKIDCEGFEENVVRGATSMIARWKPVIIVEQKRDMATKFGLQPLGAVGFLKKHHGYRQAFEIGGDYIMVPA